MKFVKKYELKSAASISVAISFMLCVFEPLTMYFLNRTDFWYDFYTLVPVCILLFVIFFALSTIVLSCIKIFLPKIYQIILTVYFAVFVALYVQGNFMVKDLPILDGNIIDWSEYSAQIRNSNIMWLLIIFTIIVIQFIFRKYFENIVKFVCICMTLMFMITIMTVGIMNEGFVRKSAVVFTTQNRWDYSSDKNFIILVLDTIDGTEESEVLAAHPEYVDALTDFTYYDNVLASYSYTCYAMPFILGGEWYTHQYLYEEWLEKTYGESPIIETLREQGYRLGMYDETAPRYGDKMFQYENVVSDRGKIRNILDFAKIELRLVGFKYLPYCLKRVSQVLPSEIEHQEKATIEILKTEFYGSNYNLYKECKEGPINIGRQKCFKVIHLEGGHPPLIYNADLTTSECTSYTGNVEATNTVVAAYIERLKKENVYDNSVIVIVSDHGFNREIGDVPDGRQHAILFVKGIGERHDKMRVDSAPISHEDLQDAYFKLLDGAAGNEIFDWHEGDARERKYLFVYPVEEKERVIYEQIQTGHAADTSTLNYSGNYYYYKN